MPLAKSGGVYERVEFPQLTFSVLDEDYATREEEITLSVGPQTARAHSVPLMRYPKFAVVDGQGSPSNILLAFPAGLQGYKFSRQFPRLVGSESSENLVLSLHIDDDLPTIAYGAIEFERSLELDSSEATDERSQASVSSTLAVFFAVDLGDANHLEPRRWTCRDISESRYGRPYQRCYHGMYDLELRTRSQLVNLTDPFFDDLVPSTWDHRSLLRKEGAKTGHGTVVLDDRTWDFSNANSVLRRNDDGHVIDVTLEDGIEHRETIIVAQITFPD